MRPINSFEFKTRLLEERDKIPLTVPCAPYELRKERRSLFHEGQRSGIHIALRCLEQTQTLLGYEFMVMVRHGRWELHGNDDDCGSSYFCSLCGNSYDEDWYRAHGHWNYCPNCGAKMDLEEAE